MTSELRPDEIFSLRLQMKFNPSAAAGGSFPTKSDFTPEVDLFRPKGRI